MKRVLPSLLSLILPLLSCAQCQYSVGITTSKDFCVGSTLQVSSSHPPESITWYQNGQPITTIKAQESLSSKGLSVATGVPGEVQGVYVDEQENLYVIGQDVVEKWAPGASNEVSVAGGHGNGSAPDQLNGAEAVYVDDQGNVYAGQGGEISMWPPNKDVGTTYLTLPTTQIWPGTIFFDCYGNVDVSDGVTRTVLQYAPGQTVPDTIARFLPKPIAGEGAPTYIGKDAKGNLFLVDNVNNEVEEWAPGATSGIHFPGGTPANPTAAFSFYDVGDVFVGGDDTLYTVQSFTQKVQKWTPGSSSAILVLGPGSFANGQYGGVPCSIFRDKYGSIYVGDQGNQRVLKFKMQSSIDTTFTPTTSGVYYAVVTDMRGFPMTTDTIYINTPQNGSPAIDITATATSTPICTPITFTATTTNAGPDAALQWEVSGVKVGDTSASYSNNLFANGDQIDCILTTAVGCTGHRTADTSNIITLSIDPQGAATVAITASDTAICVGTLVAFDATVTNGSTQPAFQWLLNGVPIPGDDTTAYHTDSLRNGDIVTCIIASDDACGLAKSNSIPLEVSPPPTIATGQVYTILHGQQVTLEPGITGNILSYLWTPGAGLSDSTIADPVASPATTTNYKLKIVSAGCGADSGYILVDVYTPVSVPNAFTPNADGHNDVFYVLGGPVNSQVEDFTVFNRWGESVFHMHDAAPGDPTRGWNGYLHGQPAPPDTYVYQILMRYADGSHQLYKGTVILIR
jgi:gliding motility-associated-like protein